MKAGVRERLRLLRNGLHDPRVTVPGIEHGDARGKIDVAPAIDVPKLGVFGLGDVDAPAADAVGHRRGFAGLEFVGFRHIGGPLYWRGQDPERYHWRGKLSKR